MSQYISEILGAREPEFTLMLHGLEKYSGKTAADVRLSLDIQHIHASKLKELGLDPKDTTPEELYQSLLSLAKNHDTFLQKAIGGQDLKDANDLLPLIKKQAEKLGLPQIWGIKHSAAKRLLKKNPPKALMKALGYRSVDSLLKRENVCEIFAALRFTESPAWQRKFIQSYKVLKPSDFEIRPLELLVLKKNKWKKLAADYVRQTRHNIVPVRELGAILLLPLPVKKIAGLTLVSLPLVLHHINELRLYSSLFKFNQVKPEFGNILVSTLLEDSPQAVILGEQPLHWRVVHSHFGRSEKPPLEVFEPHIQADDMMWRRAEDQLFRLEPALMFWQGTDFVAQPHDGRAISFNLLDMALNYYNELSIDSQSLTHLRTSLWDELFRRYLALPVYEEQALAQLDSASDMVDWE
jgi:hypothetical protein